MNKVLVLGYFGYNTNQLDGQTVKTRGIYRLVKEQINADIDFYDTEDYKYRKLSVLKMFWKVIKCDRLVYLPAHNNLKFIYPIIYFLSNIFRFKIHYFVVGGWLSEFIENLPLHKCLLARISGIHVETKRLKHELETYFQYKNVDIFPNFRFFNFTPVRNDSDKLRIVFMSRVQKMKGLDWIFHFADYIVAQRLEEKYSITFYGQISEEDRIYFETNVQKYLFVEYNGPLQPDEIYSTLSNYDVMLLPTHYYTEGLPGAIVDAYISGVPVIVTDWKHSHEFVEDGYSGYIIPFDDGQETLINKLVYLEENRLHLKQLQMNVLCKRKEFAPPSIVNVIF